MTAADPATPSGDLGWTKTLDLPWDEAIERTTDHLQTVGFGVLTEIRVHEKLEEKVGVTDFPRFTILGACNPELANEALRRDRDVALLLPCNVTVEEVDEATSRVSFADPEELLTTRFSDDATLCALAEGAAGRLRKAFDAL